MKEYITPNYKTISEIEKINLTSLMNSSLINGFTEQDFDDVMKVISRVCTRLSVITEQDNNNNNNNNQE